MALAKHPRLLSCFARPHKTLANPYPPDSGDGGGLADHVWTAGEVVALLVQPSS